MAKSDSSARDNLVQVLREGPYISQSILSGLPQLHRGSGITSRLRTINRRAINHGPPPPPILPGMR
jgi:hypothetical protein